MIKEKIIWMCWLQGENHSSLPALNRECIKKWRDLNPDWQVNILSQKTIINYVPEYFEIINNSPNRRFQHNADLLRLLLLSKYGGVWVDSSVYPMESLSSFCNKIVNETGFFSYRFIPRSCSKLGDRETVVWFLCASSCNNYLIEQWKRQLIKKFQDNSDWKYFTMAETLCELYDNDNQVKFIIDNMIQISEAIPHSAIHNWENRKDSYMYKRPNLT